MGCINFFILNRNGEEFPFDRSECSVAKVVNIVTKEATGYILCAGNDDTKVIYDIDLNEYNHFLHQQ